MPEKVPVLHCPTCYSTKFQVSRIRPEDRLHLLVLKYPVRCRNCRARVYASRSYVKWLQKEQDSRKAAKETARGADLPSSGESE